MVICYSTILHLPLLKWYKFGVGTGMGLQDIGSRAYPWYGNHHTFECVVWCFTSFTLTSNSKSCNVSLWHFIVCFSIFLLVSITLVLEISKLLIECFHGNLTPLKWLAISQQEDLFNQIWLSFNFSGEIYAATPSKNPNYFIRKKNQLRVRLLLKESVRKFPQFYLGRRSVNN